MKISPALNLLFVADGLTNDVVQNTTVSVVVHLSLSVEAQDSLEFRNSSAVNLYGDFLVGLDLINVANVKVEGLFASQAESISILALL